MRPASVFFDIQLSNSRVLRAEIYQMTILRKNDYDGDVIKKFFHGFKKF